MAFEPAAKTCPDLAFHTPSGKAPHSPSRRLQHGSGPLRVVRPHPSIHGAAFNAIEPSHKPPARAGEASLPDAASSSCRSRKLLPTRVPAARLLLSSPTCPLQLPRRSRKSSSKRRGAGTQFRGALSWVPPRKPSGSLPLASADVVSAGSPLLGQHRPRFRRKGVGSARKGGRSQPKKTHVCYFIMASHMRSVGFRSAKPFC